MNNNLTMLDFLTILSFYLQLENNDELQKQSTNDEVSERLHNDIMELLKDNRILFEKVIKQNEMILEILYEKGGNDNAR